MKKYLLLLSMLCCSIFGFAQGDYSPSKTNFIDLGLKAGVNNTWIIIDNELQNNEHHKHKFTVKPLGGVSAGIKFTDNASIMLEGFYSRQGAKFDLKDGNGSGNTIGEKEIQLDYLVVPLLIKYTGVGETRFAFQIGGQMAFLLKGKEENTFNQSGTIENSYTGGPRSYEQGTYLLATTDSDKEIAPPNPDATGKFNKKDFNVVTDIGLEHDLSDDKYLSFGLRLVYGFKDIRAEEVQAHPRDLDKYTLRYNVTGGLHIGMHWLL